MQSSSPTSPDEQMIKARSSLSGEAVYQSSRRCLTELRRVSTMKQRGTQAFLTPVSNHSPHKPQLHLTRHIRRIKHANTRSFEVSNVLQESNRSAGTMLLLFHGHEPASSQVNKPGGQCPNKRCSHRSFSHCQQSKDKHNQKGTRHLPTSRRGLSQAAASKVPGICIIRQRTCHLPASSDSPTLPRWHPIFRPDWMNGCHMTCRGCC